MEGKKREERRKSNRKKIKIHFNTCERQVQAKKVFCTPVLPQNCRNEDDRRQCYQESAWRALHQAYLFIRKLLVQPELLMSHCIHRPQGSEGKKFMTSCSI